MLEAVCGAHKTVISTVHFRDTNACHGGMLHASACLGNLCLIADLGVLLGPPLGC